MKKLNLYIDLDGVIFKYERSAYQGNNPIFNQLGKHYFRNLKSDEVMTNVIQSLLFAKDDRRIENIYFLSSMSPNHAMYLEMYKDKLEALNDLFKPVFNLNTFIACYENKAEIIKFIKSEDKLELNDILIDDFNQNLTEWQNAGGTAIKYINGINSEDSWNGYKIAPDVNQSLERQAEDIINFLYLFQSNLNPAKNDNERKNTQ